MENQESANAAVGLTTPKIKATKEKQLFPVKLLKNYRPSGEFQITKHKRDEDGEIIESKIVEPTHDEKKKMFAGAVVHLEKDEAYGLIEKKLAERADELPA